MLKFFKRQGSQQQAQDDTVFGDLPSAVDDNSPSRDTSPPLPATQLSSFEDEGLFDIDFVPDREQSRLSKTLSEVLNDKSALSYFVQFMESRNALSYLRCWLDIQNFQAAIDHFETEQKSTTHDLTSTNITNNSPTAPAQIRVVEHDSLSVSTDCDDSLTADISSLNDDSNINMNMTTTNICTTPLYDKSEKSEKSLSLDMDKYSQEFTDDALGIFKKYIALEAPECIQCADDVRNDIIEKICSQESRILNADCFKTVQEQMFNLMEKEFFDAFVQSDYFCKHQIDVLTSGHVVLEDILYNETALFYFMEFLEQENRRYLLEFWLAATNFQQQLKDQKEFLDPIEAQNDAVILYDKYFSLQALCPLGLGDRVRCAVEQNICGEQGLVNECFALPLRVVEQLLDKHHLKSFLASQLFYKYLSELINAVQSNGYGVYYGRGSRTRSSDAGSERSCSINGNSAFLAMEVPKRREKATAADMNIDTRELYDPDALWRRKKHHRLSFGRVTDLGQFVTDFEPEPDKKNRSTIRSVVKRFVNLEEDKKKEELAWQVAEMIVKGITSVTLSEHEQKV
ncbi:A-kinase anchor protein 10, mitochondrial [Atheta coriaria]|uniref:A-kinase anchor protein 10, mitochondrial n=1 Tax=Dalotia coriaria TaxID=877792 RepID=UPI0031F45CF4